MTVPSMSPIRTNSPRFSTRVYMIVSPASARPTTLAPPSEIMSPTSTDKPLKASVFEPGKYGYAIASANSQMTMLTILRVGTTVSRSSVPTAASPRAMRSKKAPASRTAPRARTKITTTVTSPGTAPMIDRPILTASSTRLLPSASPHGRE